MGRWVGSEPRGSARRATQGGPGAFFSPARAVPMHARAVPRGDRAPTVARSGTSTVRSNTVPPLYKNLDPAGGGAVLGRVRLTQMRSWSSQIRSDASRKPVLHRFASSCLVLPRRGGAARGRSREARGRPSFCLVLPRENRFCLVLPRLASFCLVVAVRPGGGPGRPGGGPCLARPFDCSLPPLPGPFRSPGGVRTRVCAPVVHARRT